MTDVQSVVAQLQQTQKGRLKYDTKDWGFIFDEKSTKLKISPFVVRNISRLATSDNALTSPNNENSGGQFGANISTRKEPARNAVIHPKPTSTLHQQTPLKKKLKQPEKLTSPPISPEYLLSDVDKEYEETLKLLSRLRVDSMRNSIKHIEDEHQMNLNRIEQHTEAKHYERRTEIHHQDNMSRHSEELQQFASLKYQREQKALEQAKQTELQLKVIADKRKRLEEMKQAIKEKKLAIGRLGENVGQVLVSVTNGFQQNKDLYAFPDSYKQLVKQVLGEHAMCTKIISAAMVENDAVDLDVKLQLVTQKTKLLAEYSKKCQDILSQLKEEKEAVEKKRIAEEEAKKAAETEEFKKKAEAAKAQAQAKVEAQAAATTAAAASITVSTTVGSANQQTTRSLPVPSIAEAAPDLVPVANLLQQQIAFFSSKEAFDSYLILRKLLLDTEKQHAPLSTSKDKDKKAFKFDLYKVVNTQINAISDESPKHLMDKIMKLNTLLTQGEVLLSGKKVSTKGSQEAVNLVKDLTAKKLVLQGQSQVASSFKTAFPIAAVCAGLWALFPDVGDLLLGHFYSQCPYLLPMYFPKGEKMTTVEYCKMVGYDVDGEKVEDQDKYLSRVSGCIRLYAAIVQMDMPPALAGRGHPHGLEHGWMWFTRILNLEPRPSVTATIIYDFLEVAGHAMMKRFGKQFQKLLLVLVQEMMPKILQITSQDSKAGATRLKMFLEKCVKEGKIKPPEGVLSQRWWSTGRN